MSTLQQILALIQSQHHVDASAFTLETGLADAGLDSLAVAELLFSIEDQFKIQLGDVAPEAVPATLGELVALVYSRRPAL